MATWSFGAVFLLPVWYSCGVSPVAGATAGTAAISAIPQLTNMPSSWTPSPDMPQVVSIAASRSSGVTVEWDDGMVVEFPLNEMRRSCPCAACVQLRPQGGPKVPADITLVSAEMHGLWGLAIVWSDGHATGIHSFEVLRRSAEAHND